MRIGVVLHYKRTKGTLEALESMASHCDKMVVWDNSLTFPRKLLPSMVNCIPSVDNVYTLGRFLAFQHEDPCATILTCDDDYVPTSRCWETLLYQQYLMPHAACVAYPAEPFANAFKPMWFGCHEVLLGWGAVFQASLAIPLLQLANAGRTNLIMRKADRLFSMLVRETHQVIVAEGRRQPWENDDHALSHLPDHSRLTREARELALKQFGRKYRP